MPVEAPQAGAGVVGEEEQPQDGRVGVRDFIESEQTPIENEADSEALDIIRRIEKKHKTTLSPEARKIVIDSQLGLNLDNIDNHTADTFNSYERLYKRDPDSKLARFVNNFHNLRKGTAGKIAASVGTSVALRSALHLLPGVFGSFAGTITGTLVGGGMGYWRAYEVEKSKQYGVDGAIAEYNRIKNDAQDPRAKLSALSFLQSFLHGYEPENEGSQDVNRQGERKEVFSGNAAELLELLVFYNSEMKSNLVEDEGERALLINMLSGRGNKFQGEFIKSTKDACKKAGIAGMKRGMLYGGLIGVASDAVSFVSHWLRTEHAQGEYMSEHYGRQNEITVTDGPAIRMDHNLPIDPHLANQGVHLEMTEWGNSLSDAVKRGIESGQLDVPQDYITEMAKQGYTDEQAINQFIYNFNFATPIEGHDWVADGLSRHFNIDGLKHLVENAVKTAHDGSFDYHNFAQTLGNADNFLSNQYPSIGVDYVVHDPVPFKESLLYQDAMADAAKHTGEGWRSILHGGLMGVGIDRATEKSAKNIAGSGGGNDERQERETQEETESTTPIKWQELFQENYQAFATSANEALFATTRNDWEQVDEADKTAIVGLFDFIKDYSAREKRFEIKVEYLGETYKVEQAPSADNPKLSLKPASGNPVTIDFAAKLGVEPVIRVVERSGEAESEIDEIQENMININEINYRFAAAGVSDQEIKMEIERKQTQGQERGARPTNKKVFPEDPGDGVIEIIGVDRENKKIKILPPSGKVVEVGEEAIENMNKLKIYKWK